LIPGARHLPFIWGPFKSTNLLGYHETNPPFGAQGRAIRKACSFRGHWGQHNEIQHYLGVAGGQKRCNEMVGDELTRIKQQTCAGKHSIKIKPRRSLILQGLRRIFLYFI